MIDVAAKAVRGWVAATTLAMVNSTAAMANTTLRVAWLKSIVVPLTEGKPYQRNATTLPRLDS
jgi:hypothetical protein